MKTFSVPELSVDVIDDGQNVSVSFDPMVTSIKTDNGRVSIGREQWLKIVERSEAFSRMITAAALPDTVLPACAKQEVPELGEPYQGGFYAGTMTIGGQFYALVVSPKATGEASLKWKTSRTVSPGTQSPCDGRANSGAMADADHPAAKFCRDLRIAGHDDWYLPSKDELNLLYQNLAPGNAEASAFLSGAAEAFEQRWYWSSTEFYPVYAWFQRFGGGYQFYGGKVFDFFVRAVRKVLI